MSPNDVTLKGVDLKTKRVSHKDFFRSGIMLRLFICAMCLQLSIAEVCVCVLSLIFKKIVNY